MISWSVMVVPWVLSSPRAKRYTNCRNFFKMLPQRSKADSLVASMTGRENEGFPVTRWSLIVSTPDRDQKEALCHLYWRPIFGHLRQRGWSREDAEDLTQTFFLRLVNDQTFQTADPKKGKLRTYLLGSLKRHLVDHHRYRQRLKRGGDVEHVPLAFNEADMNDAEYRYATVEDGKATPEEQFDRTWALDLLQRAHARLEKDYKGAGKEKEYRALKPALIAGESVDAEEASRKLGIKPASVRVLIHRLRQNFRAALRDETAETLSSRADIDEELAYLLSVF